MFFRILSNYLKYAFVSGLISGSLIYAGSAVWTNGDGDDIWGSANNWNPNTVPNGVADTATFPYAIANASPTLNSNIELGELINNNIYLYLDGINNYTLTVNDSITISDANQTTYLENLSYLVLGNGCTINNDGISIVVENSQINTPLNSINLIGGTFDLQDVANSISFDTIALSEIATLTIAPTDGNPFQVNTITMDGALDLVAVRGDVEYTLTTDITGNGRFQYSGSGSLSISGNNTYSGGTIVSGGTLNGTTATIPSAGGVSISNGNILAFNQATTGTYSGVISGEGSLGVIGGGVITLSGANTYEGGSIIAANTTLKGTTSSIPSSGGIANEGILIFDQSISGEYSGVISGSGNLTKTGSGTVTLSRVNTLQGQVEINAGVLSITNTSSLDQVAIVQVNAGTFQGAGSVSFIDNQSVVQAGLVPGDTLSVNQTYNQIESATLISLINPASASKLFTPGQASLAGTLELDIAPGVYTDNTSYVVVEAEGGFNDSTFDTLVENHSADWTLSYNSTQAIVTVTGNSIVTPVSASQLSGNDLSIYNYMFGNSNFVTSNTDLTAVSNAMVALSPSEFKEALIKVTPLSANALPFSGFQNNLQMAVVLDNEFQTIVTDELKKKQAANNSSSNNESSSDLLIAQSKPEQTKVGNGMLCYGIPKTGLFVEPIFLAYHQKNTQGSLNDEGQVGFSSYTYGAGVGWEQILEGKWVLEGGVGYTHSNLHWDDNFGNARWSTLYLAPFAGYFNEKVYANFMMMAAFNFIHGERRIAFTGFERVAKSNYHAYDLLLRANGGYRFALKNNFWFQPDGTLNYLTVFTESYQESGANSINLDVKQNTNFILQPSFRAKLIKQFYHKTICFAPNIYAGWLANVPLKTQKIEARFQQAPNQTFFNIGGYYETTNQMILGAEYFMEKQDTFIASSSFEADFLSKLQVYTVKLKFQWIF